MLKEMEPEFSESMAGDHRLPAAVTDTGCERDLNEDRYAVVESPSGTAWLVCDGMGGQAGGELAAQLAIDAIRRDLESQAPRRPLDALHTAIIEANRIIVLRRQNQAFVNMGTTVVAALFWGKEVVLGNAGDSRAYLVRDNAIQQLTIDHTYVQQLVDSGQIRAEDALSHPQAHILTRCLGSEPGLQIDMQRFWIDDEGSDDDILILCSDGLYSMVGESEIAELVTERTPEQACSALVDLAKERGGFDNITLAVIPLGGQLVADIPEGYDEEQSQLLRQLREPPKPQGETLSEVLRTATVIVVLSVLGFFMTVLLVAIMIRTS